MRTQPSLLRGASFVILLAALSVLWPTVAHGQVASIDFSANNYTGAEGAAIEVTVNITTAPGAGNQATVHYTTVDSGPNKGTAVANRDYVPTSGNLVFGATTTSATFFVQTIKNDWILCDPTIVVKLSNAQGQGVAVILGTQNNDAPTTVTITKDAAPTATATAADAIRDTEGLLPLEDWVPLFTFNLSTSADNPAFRRIEKFVYTIKHDGFKTPPRPYNTYGGHPPQDTIQEFALVLDSGVDGKPDGLLNQYDSLLFTWDNSGAPYGTVSETGAALVYNLDFWNKGYLLDPNGNWPRPAADGIGYMVVVRTSPYWFNWLTMSSNLLYFRMLDKHGTFPYSCDDPTKPLDTYPDLTKPFVASERGYSSSFAVHDITSGVLPNPKTYVRETCQAWNYPNYLYTPNNENIRPRWDKTGNFFDLVTGEWLDLRNIFPLEQWNAVLGITAHGSANVVFSNPDPVNGYLSSPGELDEVNVVLMDLGADPLVPGSGGFDPRTALHTVTEDSNVYAADAHHAVGNDYAFNGLWVFHDTNGNGIFDPPTQTTNNGITFTDFPLFPYGTNISGQVTPGIHEWEYVSFPPDGGDPWWKMKLNFANGRRRNGGETPTGYLDPTPHPYATGPYIPSDFYHNYFVVLRPDSGYQDVSLLPGDGTGMPLGANIKAIIEPRRYNAFKQQEDGGIHFTLQRAPLFEPWQNDTEWTNSEPWWPQRTHNANNTKPIRQGIEVHDLVITRKPDNTYDRMTDIEYDTVSLIEEGQGLPNVPTTFDSWLDPFNYLRDNFHYRQNVGEWNWIVYAYGSPGGSVDPVFNPDTVAFQFPFETAPFFNPYFDGVASPPRSIYFANPPAQPSLPTYATWLANVGPSGLAPGRYPSITDWAPSQRATRILRQHMDANGPKTAILGFNLVGVDDPVTNRIAPVRLTNLTIAFYGPDFNPKDFLALSATGASTSGVALYEDSDGDGVYEGDLGGDTPVPLQNLAWRTAPELIDIDGDGVADDINGDGVVNNDDRAWVLTLQPAEPWLLPISDERDISAATTTSGKSTDQSVLVEDAPANIFGLLTGVTLPGVEPNTAATTAKSGNPTPLVAARQVEHSRKSVYTFDATAVRQAAVEKAAAMRVKGAKALTAGSHPGDDLFVVIQPSDTVRRFEQVKALIPATLPTRAVSARQAGVKLLPANQVNARSLAKVNPEEGAVQDYYGFDYLEMNIPTKVTDLTTTGQLIPKNSPATALLGIQCSSNRGNAGMAATGTNGVGALKSLTVPGATWAAGAFTGYFLIDGNYESFEITGNTANTLTLLSGTPKSGYYRIEIDPSFLEQVVVEVYEPDDGSFRLADSLEPLDIDQTKSGIALYRDNDQDPNNRNGKFDPDIDIPVKLDMTPYIAARAGEPPNQIRFIFSTPGTDNLGPGSTPLPKASQTRHRQWVPDTFGSTASDPDTGPTFFVVVRTSNNFAVGSAFKAAIVSWGPNTPTEPDPDTFPAPPTTLRSDEFDIFSEFPWGSRAIGFITFYKDPTKLNPPDLSGFNWVRSTVSQATQTSWIYGGVPTPGADDVVISSASRSVLPTIVGANGLDFTISGKNFGTAPIVTMNGTGITVTSASDTLIAVTVAEGVQFTALPVLLKVTNSTTGKFAVRDDLFTLPVAGDVNITGVSPNQLDPSIGPSGFKFSISGSGFGNSPTATLNGIALTIDSATDNTINVTIPANTPNYIRTGYPESHKPNHQQIADSR